MSNRLGIQPPLAKVGISCAAFTPLSASGSLRGFGDLRVIGGHAQVMPVLSFDAGEALGRFSDATVVALGTYRSG